MTATIQGVTVDPSEMSETEKQLFAIIEKQADRIEELEEKEEDEPQPSDLFEVRTEDDNPGLSDVWIAGTPIGKLIERIMDNIDEMQEDLSTVEESIEDTHTEDTTPRVEDGETGSQNGDTPLEQICALPEHMVDTELTENQKRARFIAKDVRDYAEKAPAGLVIDSGTIKKVIRAAEGKKPHTQTVARVMDFLDELGKQDVHQKKRRGKKLVMVDEEAADRYHSCCDRGIGETPPQSVMS